MTTRYSSIYAVIVVAMSCTAAAAFAAEVVGANYASDAETTSDALNTRGYSPYAGRKYPTQVLSLIHI